MTQTMGQRLSIRDIERQIDHIKLLNKLGKMPHHKAKTEIRELEIELRLKIDSLPRYERSIARIKREYGKEF